jgi:hypothetical protein
MKEAKVIYEKWINGEKVLFDTNKRNLKMKVEFTKTPWKFRGDIEDHRGNTVYEIFTEVVYDGRYTTEATIAHVEEYEEVPNWHPNREADARLISAAPDLLNALLLMKSSFLPKEDWEGTGISNVVQLAIDKALGG